MKRKKQISPRSLRNLKTAEKVDDPIERALLAQSPPRIFGYFLIILGIVILVTLVLGFRAGALNSYAITVLSAWILFLILIGFAQIRKKRL